MQLNIICLKTGSKYSSEYVNKLFNMCERHISKPFRFVCFTDDTSGINSIIETKPLLHSNKNVTGWFNKLAFFQKKIYDLQGLILYIDLDVVFVSNIDEMINYHNNDFVIIEDWLYKKLKQKKYNSSIMKWHTNNTPELFKSYIDNFAKNKKYAGDQDFITDNISNPVFWPEDWVQSFKINKCFDEIPEKSKIIVFHGKPNPHEINYGWVKHNWV